MDGSDMVVDQGKVAGRTSLIKVADFGRERGFENTVYQRVHIEVEV